MIETLPIELLFYNENREPVEIKEDALFSARDLHALFDLKKDFLRWSRKLLSCCGVAGVDYHLIRAGKGNRQIDYHMNHECARSMATLQYQLLYAENKRLEIKLGEQRKKIDMGARLQLYLITRENYHNDLTVVN